MAIDFTCPHCNHHSRVDDKFGGQTGPCVECKQMVTVPLAPRRPLRDKQGGLAAATGISVAATVGIISVALVCAVSGMTFFSWYMFRLGTGVMAPPGATVAVAAPVNNAAQNNLRTIGMAMEQYHDVHGCFPPAAGLDEDGKPAHSWRVYLLPYLNEDALYERYNFDEPWNSPGNRLLHDEMPSIFRCNTDYAADANASSFRLITGEGALMKPGKSGSLADCYSGGGSTILVVEVAGSGQNWLEPGELDIDKLQGVNESMEGNSISSSDDLQGAMVLMANGITRRLHKGMSPDNLRRLALLDPEEDEPGEVDASEGEADSDEPGE